MTTQSPSAGRNLDENTQRIPIAVVTGATGGMGQAIAAALADTHIVYALGRNEVKLHAMASERIIPVACDLLQLSDANPLPEQLHGVERVDVLVHAAAVATRMPLQETTTTQWQRQMMLNVIAPATLTRALLPQITAAEGLVVFINSGAGTHVHPGLGLYCATKHALYALADTLRKEVAGTGVRVTTLAPGPTDTEMLQGITPGEYAPEKYIDPKEVAIALLGVLAIGPSAQIANLSVRPRSE
ncbi:short chain dehydrogenase [Corynebacterium sp. 13CS0277]|uniref:SDR family oxidoreductase n=1 Tax=Corynebacterium sp. 13CS0277 TaxID=2071994 RepID=UPI000D02E6EB|nr:SDR family oxidoreductase [Corynebacterium sp. 13CS0277]PRQ10817.1 short chain dehydrogenase [Corynebacterium sp. 13CS0277]